ncbi:response regulator [Undibacterium sp. RuRC25W]|uniref:response regulator n=1 Tax=Undibacterium sp. RuRC25W TaxID=3413047 RepID=UPI003BF23E06
MSQKTPTIAIRLLGFSAKEEETFFAVLAVAREKGYSYTCLMPGSVQDPDMYIVNAEQLSALATLSDLNPGEAQPVLLIGKTDVPLPYEVMSKPIRWRKIFDVLDSIINKRELLLTTLGAYAPLTVHERRREKRLDLDLTDPTVYERIRKLPVAKGGILIVDKDTHFREYVAAVMDPYGLTVTLASDERSALLLDRNNQHVLTLINTSTPNVDPYRLCDGLKKQNDGLKTSVIFLIDKSFEYQNVLAERVKCAGFLVKPLSRRVLMRTLNKYLQLKSKR